jgi:GDP/UDP-N,N'-diacetylbacillosamine 2-epimerase (hydrolysing)
MNRRICVVTGSRAEYGLLRWVMEEIRATSGLTLQIAATGAHLSPEFGLTYREIEQDGFTIDRRVEMLLSSDTPSGIAKAIGLGTIGFADVFADLRPDVLLVLGDRFEILSAATAALIARVPIAHLHGGERTEGAVDEAIRHAITKMSHLHFVATEEYRRRVIQLGESPDRVFMVGGLGVDGITRQKLLDRAELEQSLGYRLGKRTLLVTFHPVSLENATSADQMRELLMALDELPDVHLIFTAANADADGRVLIRMVEEFVARRENAAVFTSLGQQRYLSCLRHVDGVVGNSSSGLTEVPSFHIGTVNIGDRQRGRVAAASVIAAAPERKAIRRAIDQLFDPQFRGSLARVKNPYGDGGASKRVVEALRSAHFDDMLKKQFFDLPAGGQS